MEMSPLELDRMIRNVRLRELEKVQQKVQDHLDMALGLSQQDTVDALLSLQSEIATLRPSSPSVTPPPPDGNVSAAGGTPAAHSPAPAPVIAAPPPVTDEFGEAAAHFRHMPRPRRDR